MTRIARFADLESWVGKPLGTTTWLTIEQAQVTAFAEATHDMDWMHVDPERARSGPVGATIGQGFLTLSLLTYFSHALAFMPEDVSYAFNYGLDRVRWITPVIVGKRIRNHSTLIDVTCRGDGLYLIKTGNTVEIEGEERPAMTADWLGLVKPGDEA
jgi:acyl dehydratase